MKITRNQISNIIFILIVVVLLFTPVGKHVKVFVNRLIAFSPSVTAVEKREKLDDYDWALRDLNGAAFNLNTTKGKVVMVNLWATWCPQCIAEMPALQHLYDDYKDKVVFLFVSNERSDVINGFLTKKDYHLPVYIPRSAVPKTLFSKSIPATYLIDKKGNIVIKKIGVADWNSQKVRKLIDELLLE